MASIVSGVMVRAVLVYICVYVYVCICVHVCVVYVWIFFSLNLVTEGLKQTVHCLDDFLTRMKNMNLCNDQC